VFSVILKLMHFFIILLILFLYTQRYVNKLQICCLYHQMLSLRNPTYSRVNVYLNVCLVKSQPVSISIRFPVIAVL